MKQKDMLTASIVLYNNEIKKLKKAIESFLATDCDKHLYLIDNSETKSLSKELNYGENVSYIHAGKNLGFGAGHNIIMKDIADISKYHLILNPDVYFDSNVLPYLMDYLENNLSVGVVGPKIVYPDKRLQHSIRKFPRFQDFFIRRISFLNRLFLKRYNRYHYLDKEWNEPMLVDSISGCFQLFRTKVLLDIKGFDERYFMYLEDIDICRKTIKKGYEVCFNPLVRIVHYFEKGSAKRLKLLIIHIDSLVKYSFKWKFK
ncbi:glycosyltransferase family 2 protein [Aquimarina sp. SS2-1]|uniref:glycosyltransferase family 2 protein n=1 Tax=Aquimarina besae TaxID=3342247 RepID=UPI00366FBD24